MRNGKQLPFDTIISCNIGNPHSLEQSAISFVRNVLSIVINPSLLSMGLEKILPMDCINRAKKYLDCVSDIGGLPIPYIHYL